MKQFLVVVTLLGLSAYASSNPFDLQENLQKIDQDQDILLHALKEMSDKREAQEASTAPEEAMPPTKLIEDLVSEENKMPSEESIKENLVQKQIQKESSDEKNAVQASTQEEVNELEAISQEEIRLKKLKEEQAKIEQARAEQSRKEQAKAEEARIAAANAAALEDEKRAAQKKEEERLEVEAYEAQRLAKQKEEAKIEAQNSVDKKENGHAVVDINITREALEAKAKADQAYLEAIKEMD